MIAEKVFAVIAESTRRDILDALAQENKAVGQLVDELGVSQPTVSKHLRVLREAGVVTMRAEGQKRFYGINTEPLVLVSAWLESLGAGAAVVAAVAAVAEHPAPDRSAAALAVVESESDGRTNLDKTPVVETTAEGVAAQARTLPVPAAASVNPVPVTATVVASPAASSQVATIVHSHDVEGGVQGQISRSVGRAATRAADLLANLPTLPAFRRRKD